MSSRKALLVGINNYTKQSGLSPLDRCISDTQQVADLLAKHDDKSKNFGCKTLLDVTRDEFRTALEDLFNGDGHHEIALFYFSGHGDATRIFGKDGRDLTYNNIADEVRKATKNRHNIVIIDSCHSGELGNTENDSGSIKLGTTFLMSSEGDRYSYDGVFGRLLVDALTGYASNIIGEITMASIYGYMDRLLGEHQQRPTFKTHVQDYVVIRKTQPKIKRKELENLLVFFETENFQYQLDPTYEPDDNTPDKNGDPKNNANSENTAKFELMQTLNRFGLLKPSHEKHMYYAAINRDTVELTMEGKFYWQLLKQNRI